MARWNELAGSSRYSKQMLSVVQMMENTVLVAFGPHGRAALIREPTGSFTVTRTGLEILCACYSSSGPVSCILLNSARDLYQRCGDGVKSFLIEVSALLHRCVDLGRSSHTTMQLMLLQQRLCKVFLPTSEKAYFSPRSPNTVAEVLVTFLACRLPDTVACSLASLLSEWVSSLTSIKLALHKFDLLCLHQCSGIGSVSGSRVRQGFCITREAQNFLGPGLYHVIMLSFGDSDASSGKFDSLDVQCEVNKLVRELESRDEKEVTEIAGTLIITPVILPDLAMFILRKHHVSVVQGVLEEEMDFVYMLLAKNETRLVHVRQEILGSKEYTCLDLPGVSQLLLYAPSHNLRLEYARVSCDALKVVSLMDMCSILSVSGQFETLLLVGLRDRFKLQLPQLATRCVVGRSRLLEWHRKLNKASAALPEHGDNGLSEICKAVAKAFDSLDREIVEAVGHALLAMLQKLPASVPPGGKEPVALRLMLLQHALAATAALLKVDGVVPVCSVKR